MSETAKVLNLHTPGGFERVLETMGEKAQTRTLPPRSQGVKVVDATRNLISSELGLRVVAVVDPLL